MNWKLRCLLRIPQAFLPFQDRIRELKFRISKPPRVLTELVIEKGVFMLNLLREAHVSLDGKVALEIGPGWEPTLPLMMRLAGCKRVKMMDLNRLQNATNLARTVEILRDNADGLAQHLHRPKSEVLDYLRLPESQHLEAMLEHFGLEYCAPCDATSSGMDSGTVDIVYSHTVLEHVPPAVIRCMFAEFYRILCLGGITFHRVDNTDHWAHFDTNIHKLNFLKYEDRIWKITGINRLDYQNRLRQFEYLKMLDEAGFGLLMEKHNIDERGFNDLPQMKICSKYRGCTNEELARTGLWFVAQKPLR